jgi:hypothetical protein
MLTLTVTARADDFVGVRVADGATDDAARLIAAAPDMLAALRSIIESSDANCGDSLANAISAARAAIARATGGK